MRYSSEWEKTVTRLGRWIDFKNDYKTLDPKFMESVWWVFRQLWDKDLVYRGFKVMPYSVACGTPLCALSLSLFLLLSLSLTHITHSLSVSYPLSLSRSLSLAIFVLLFSFSLFSRSFTFLLSPSLANFEASSNYKDKSDPYILVSFPLVDEPQTELVVMTTTPWTLPSNLALCMNPDLDYAKILDKETGRHYVLLKSRLSELYKDAKEGEHYTLLDVSKGSAYKDKKYVPMFDYFIHLKEKGAFRVVCDSYVKDDSGTGIVHQGT